MNPLPPRLHIREEVEIDAGEEEAVDPAKGRDVRDAVFVADEVVGGGEVVVEDPD